MKDWLAIIGNVVGLVADWIRRLWTKKDAGLIEQADKLREALDELRAARRELDAALQECDAGRIDDGIRRVCRAKARVEALDHDAAID